MGPNGSGKSTLAHALMGRPGTAVTAGSIPMDGRELVGLPAWERARAGLFLALRIRWRCPAWACTRCCEAAVDGAGATAASPRPSAWPRRRRPWASTRASCPAPLNVDLSGGEHKRTEMVQLGVLRPAVCILDEIDSGLDVDALGDVARRLQRATVEWGVGILAITHFHRFLVELEADVVHVMVDGRIVATGDADLALQLEQTGYRGYRDAG